ncbi:hypothetical protein VP01_12744g1 [Puccinia sorghi]|uniref:Uncharacterized protein n=1 Tax=Puccinia sorghi TaxID=27349 RepID=A0A0L6VNW6_9BASI|nr:hypothetical protein VP01_12744g1 [Puccinia sorghi]
MTLSSHQMKPSSCTTASFTAPASFPLNTNQPSAKVKFLPFNSMAPAELHGWERLVCFFLGQAQFVEPVKNNGPLKGGVMWAEGWNLQKGVNGLGGTVWWHTFQL